MSKKVPKNIVKRASTIAPRQREFDRVLALIEAARTRAFAAINTALIDLYWSIGEHIAKKIANEGWGKGTVQELAEYIRRRNLMRGAFPHRISGGCANSSRPTAISQNSHHW